MIVKCEDTQVRLPNCRPIAFPLANYWEEMDSDVKCFLWQETISTTFTIFALITVNRSFPITLTNQCTAETELLIRWSNVPIIVDNFSKELYHSKKEPTEFLCVVVRYNWSSNFIQIFTRKCSFGCEEQNQEYFHIDKMCSCTRCDTWHIFRSSTSGLPDRILKSSLQCGFDVASY